MQDHFFEDFEVGETFESQGMTLTEGAIIDFALTYDPQPFHIDKVAATASHFGGLIASGWQVAAIGFRLITQTGFLKGGGMGSPGLEDVRWHRPVRPGDTLRTTAAVTEIRPSSSRRDRGYVTLAFEILNQDDAAVMSFSAIEIIARRPTEKTT